MKDRSFASAIFSFIMGAMIILTPSSTVWSYANAAGPSGTGGPHRKINELALAKFTEFAARDAIMFYYDFEPSRPVEDLGLKLALDDHPFTVDGKTVTIGGDWYKDDVTIKSDGIPWIPTFIEEQDTTRTFKWWIVEGGYTADEPESYMALRHFYDPTKSAQDKQSGEFVSYLTDDLDPYISPLLMGANPHVNAKDWAQSKSPYSLEQGSEALDAAFSTSTIVGRRDLLGKAWRSMGETMHLLADMTVPAHVRNDSHPGVLNPRWENIKNLKSDPYEDYVTAEEVADRSGYTVDPELRQKIDKCTSVAKLFDLVSKYTNSSFFSTDTISGTDAINKEHTTNFNAQPREYDSPKLDTYVFKASDKDDGSGYYISKDGNLSVVRRDADGRHRIDRVCAMDQANRMIPIAIYANIKLLDCLVPKVKVNLIGFDMNSKVFRCHAEVMKRSEDGKYEKSGYGLCPTSGGKAVVYSMVGEKKNYWLPITKINEGDFEIDGSEFYADVVNAVKNNRNVDKIYYSVGMDMGGIIVKSDVMEQPITRQEDPEPQQPQPKKDESISIAPSAVQGKPGDYSFTVNTALSPDLYKLQWDFGDGTPAAAGDSRMSHTYNRNGDYVLTVKLYNTKTRKMVDKTTAAVKISEKETNLDQIRKSMRISISAFTDSKYLTISDMGSKESHTYDSGHLPFGMYCKNIMSPGITWSGASFEASGSYAEDENGDQHNVTVQITGQLSSDGMKLLNIKGMKKSVFGDSADTYHIEIHDVALQSNEYGFCAKGKAVSWSLDWTHENPSAVGFTPYTVRGSSVLDTESEVTFEFGIRE